MLKQMLTTFGKDKVIELLIAATEKFSVDNGYTKPEFTEYGEASEKVQKIFDLLQSGNFGVMAGSLRNLVEEIMGIKLPPITMNSLVFYMCSVVVPVSNPNSHDYQIGRPTCVCMINSDGRGVRGVKLDGEQWGNNLPVEKGAIRPATREEITEWIERLVTPSETTPRRRA